MLSDAFFFFFFLFFFLFFYFFFLFFFFSCRRRGWLWWRICLTDVATRASSSNWNEHRKQHIGASSGNMEQILVV